MRLAYTAYPNEYGLFSVYRNLRSGLSGYGIELRWVSTEPECAAAVANPLWEGELGHGDYLPAADEEQRGRGLIEHLEKGGFDGVIINPPQSACEMNCVRYLDRGLLRLAIVHSSAPGALGMLRGIKEHLHATVAVSPRGREGLLKRGLEPSRTHLIPNAIDMTPFDAAARRPSSGPLRMLYLGRIEHATKGTLYLPEIMRRLEDVAMLDIAGDGKDTPDLRARCAGLEERVRFLGLVPTTQVPELCAGHEVLILPSRTEGLPMTLVEAMAAGCVPVASRIRGVTDFVIDEGKTGLLFPIGDVAAAAGHIRVLAADRPRLESMSAKAAADVRARFGIAGLGRAYAELIQAIGRNPPTLAEALPRARWEYPASFKGGMGRFVPRWAKQWLKAVLSR